MSEDIKSTLQAEIAAIEGQLEHFRNELKQVENSVPMNMSAYYQFQSEVGTAEAKLAAKMAELGDLEDVAEQAQEQAFQALDNIVIGTETVELTALTTDEYSAQLIRIAITELLTKQAEQHYQIVRRLEESQSRQVESLEKKLEESENAAAALEAKADELSENLFTMQNERDDALTKRDAAVAQAEEYKAEVEKLRQQIAESAKPAQPSEDGKAALERWKASRTPIYDKEWTDPQNRKTYKAKLAATGEPITFGFLEAGKYREVSADEVSQFRQSLEAEPSEAEPVQEVAVPSVPLVEELQFPSYEEANTDVDGLVEADAGAQVAGTEVTREEFQALVKRVEALEVR